MAPRDHRADADNDTETLAPTPIQSQPAGNRNPDGSYVVGKSRPPEHGKFRVGDNRPRGRRQKNTRNFKSDLAEELNIKISVSENGALHKVTKQRATIKVLTEKALKGNVRALDLLLRLERQHFPDTAEVIAPVISLSDQDIIEQFLAGYTVPQILDDDALISQEEGASGHIALVSQGHDVPRDMELGSDELERGALERNALSPNRGG